MAWWLLDSVINGTLDEDYPIMSKKEKDVTILGGEEKSKYWFDYDRNDPNKENPFEDSITLGAGSTASADTLNFGSPIPGGMGDDHISFNTSHLVDDVYAYHFPGTEYKPEPNLEYKSQKYEEDAGIKDLKDYISSTYSGHYTSEQNNTQTLDLIQSVGDAESFCRSNAIKYLARYDKKGSAKRDILKAMHYCLLLYYFSGNTQNEITTSGYETF